MKLKSVTIINKNFFKHFLIKNNYNKKSKHKIDRKIFVQEF